MQFTAMFWDYESWGGRKNREKETENIVFVNISKVTGYKNKFRIGDNENFGPFMNELWWLSKLFVNEIL